MKSPPAPPTTVEVSQVVLVVKTLPAFTGNVRDGD